MMYTAYSICSSSCCFYQSLKGSLRKTAETLPPYTYVCTVKLKLQPKHVYS